MCSYCDQEHKGNCTAYAEAKGVFQDGSKFHPQTQDTSKIEPQPKQPNILNDRHYYDDDDGIE